MADETKRRILSLLAGGERCVCALQEELDAGESLLCPIISGEPLASTIPSPRSTRYAARDEMIAGPGTRNAVVCLGALLGTGDLATRHAPRRRQ